MADQPLQSQPASTELSEEKSGASQSSISPVIENKQFLPLKWFKKISFFIWHFHRKLLLSLIISIAFILLLLRAFAFYLEDNPEIAQQLVESQLHGRVTFDKIKVNTNLFFPAVSMHNFTFKTQFKEEKQLKF